MFDPNFDVDYEIHKNGSVDDLSTSDINILKAKLNNKKSRNVRVVKVRTAHRCEFCNDLINKGDECLTVNKYGYKGRYWVCLACLDSRGIDI